MSRQIDERVVEMKFDNKEFERNAKKSMSTLDRLKKSLNLEGAAKGFDEIDKASKKVDVTKLGSALDTVKTKFSALETIAVGSLLRIGQQAVDAGEKLIKSLTIEPISQGFDEYELKMGSVQTIMASTGAALDEVNQYLEELNHYADKTIYSFSDMTQNIGKFTNAGVKLEDAVKAIQGVSNEAAISGANANEASRAMYNFAQALSAGYVKLIDWKSIENANMATVAFKQNLIDTALAMGTIVEESGAYRTVTTDNRGAVSDLFNATMNFNDALSHQWLTTDVLVQSLSNYATDVREMTEAEKKAYEEKLRAVGYTEEQIASIEKLGSKAFDAAQDVKTFTQLIDTLKEAVGSGWAQTFEIIFGDFNEAKALWTEFSQVIGGFIDQQSTARNELLRGGLGSGWKQFLAIDELKNTMISGDYSEWIMDIATDHGIAVYDMIEETGSLEAAMKKGWVTADLLGEGIDKLTKRYKEYSSEELAARGVTAQEVHQLEILNKMIKRGAISLDEYVDKINRPTGRDNLIQSLRNSCEALLAIIHPIGEAFDNIFPDITADKIYNMTVAIRDFTANLKISGETGDKIRRTFEGIFAVFDIFGQAIGAVIRALIPGIGYVGDFAGGVLDITANIGDSIKALDDYIRENKVFVIAVEQIKNALKIAVGAVAQFLTSISTAARNIYEKGKVLIPDEIIQAIHKFVVDIQDAAKSLKGFDLTNIGEMFTKVREAVQKLGETIIANDSIRTYITNMSKYFDELKENLTFDNAISHMESFMTKVQKFLKWLREMFSTAAKNLGLSEISAGGILAAGGGLGIIYAIIKAASSLDKVASSVKTIPEILKTLAESIGGFERETKADAIKKIATSILLLTAALVALSFADMKKVLAGALILSAVFGVIALAVYKLKTIPVEEGDPLDPLNTFASGLSRAMDNLTQAAKWKGIASVIKSIGQTLLLVAATVAIIAYTYKKDPESFKVAAEFVALVAATITAMVGAFALIGQVLDKGARNISKLGIGMLAISASLLVAITAVNKIFKLEIPSDYGKKLTIMAGVFAGLLIVARVSQSNKDSGGNSWLRILALTSMLYICVKALDKLFKIELPEDYKEKLGIMAGIFAELALVTRIISGGAGTAKASLKTGGALIGMSLFMVTAALALKKLSDIDIEKLRDSALIFAALLLDLAISLATIEKASGSSKGTFKTVLAMAVSVGTIVAALGILSFIPGEKLKKGVVSLAAVLVSLSVALHNAAKNTSANSFKTVVTMTAAVAAIAGSLYLLASKPWSSLLGAAGAIGGTILAFAKALEIISKTRGLNTKDINNFLLATLAVIPIGAALVVLSNQPWQGMIASGLALGIVVAAFAESLKMISKASGIKTQKIGNFLLATLAVIPIGAALAILANQPWEGMVASGIALGLTLQSFAESLKMISAMRGLKVEKIGVFLLATLAVIPIGAALAVLANQPWDGMLVAAASISAVILAMSGVLAICAAVGRLGIDAAIQGILSLDILLASLAGVMTVFGILYQSDAVKSFLNGGIEVMAAIGKGIGEFVGSIASGMMISVSAGLPNVADNLSEFAHRLQPFITDIKNLDKDVLKSVGILTGVMVALAAAEVLSAITSLLSFFTGGNSLETLGFGLAAFIPYFVQFARGTEGINGTKVKMAASALGELFKALSKVPNEGGLISWIVGENSLEGYGEKIEQMGDALYKFYIATREVEQSSVESSAESLITLFNAFKKVPNDGGLVGLIFGENSIEGYGEKLASIGLGLYRYWSIIKDIDEAGHTAIENSAKSLVSLFNAFKEVPNDGGLAGIVFGENNLLGYDAKMSSVGLGLYNYWACIKDIDSFADINTSAWSLRTLFNAFSQIPTDGGLVGKIFGGTTDLSSIGTALADIGTGLSIYYKSITGIAYDELDKSIEAVRNLFLLAADVDSLENVYSLEEFLSSFQYIGEDCVTKFGQAFLDSQETISETIQQFLQMVGGVIEENYPVFYEQGIMTSTNWQNGIIGTFEVVYQTGLALANQVLNALTFTLPSFYAKGVASGVQYLNGIRVKYPEAYSVGQQLGTNALSGVQLIIPQFLSLGEQAGQGFVDGLNSMIGQAMSIANSFASSVPETMAGALDMHSPSKVTESQGELTGEGFIIGLAKMISKVKDVGTQLTDEVIESTQMSIGTISSMFANSFDSGLKITPLIDLSNVETSAQKAVRMFNESLGHVSVRASGVYDSVDGVVTSRTRQNFQNESSSPTKGGNVYNFNQTNNSPKSLSRIEIYRDTRNQFSAFKRYVEKSNTK